VLLKCGNKTLFKTCVLCHDYVVAASVFCAPGVTLQKDPGQASSSKQHKGDDGTDMLRFYRFIM